MEKYRAVFSNSTVQFWFRKTVKLLKSGKNLHPFYYYLFTIILNYSITVVRLTTFITNKLTFNQRCYV